MFCPIRNEVCCEELCSFFICKKIGWDKQLQYSGCALAEALSRFLSMNPTTVDKENGAEDFVNGAVDVEQ